MFAVIYSFKIKPGQVQNFEKVWKEMTTLIAEYEGSLGSRLHKQDEFNFIAYAQWQDKMSWKKSGSKLPEVFSEIRNTMKESCDKIETLFELEVVQDLLIK